MIQRAQKSKNTNIGTHQRPSENVALFRKLCVQCSDEKLGNTSIEALNKFDLKTPQYDLWENKELNKLLCS